MSEDLKPRKREKKAQKKMSEKKVEPKRGRKKEQWERYVKSANDKISLYRTKLKTAIEDGVPAKTRSKWRNIITAQVSRLKHKTLIRILHKLIDGKDSGLKTLLNIVSKNLMGAGQQHLLAKILTLAQERLCHVDAEVAYEYQELLTIVGIELEIPTFDRDFQGEKANETEFADGIMPLLQTSKELLAPFPNNDEKGDDQYDDEA